MAMVLRRLRLCVIPSANLYTHEFVFSTLQAVDNKTQNGTKIAHRTESQMRAEFEKWLVDYKRVYPNADEKERRFNVFKNTICNVDEMNAKYNPGCRFGLNKFADLTYDEFRCRWTGRRPSRLSHRPKGYYAKERIEKEMVARSIRLDKDYMVDERRNIMVRNLPQDVNAFTLKRMFSNYGNVVYTHVDPYSLGSGIVSMDTEYAVDDAILYLKGQIEVEKFVFKGSLDVSNLPLDINYEEMATRSLYVSNLPQDADDEKLKQMFSEYGKVVEALVGYNLAGQSLGIGSVIMKTESEIDSAISNLDNQMLNGRLIRVEGVSDGTRILY